MMDEKIDKIVELDIDDEQLEEEIFEGTGVEIVSIVDRPAIQADFLYFNQEEFITPNPCQEGYEAIGTKIKNGREVPNCVPIQNEEEFVEPMIGENHDDYMERCIGVEIGEGKPQDQAVAICHSKWEAVHGPTEMEEHNFETYNDYPEGARSNACRAIEWAEENGWGSCGTDVGKQRAHQLCKGENISRDTISRMAAFERHRQNSDTPYSEGCGKLMWDSWGGDSGIRWAQNKLEELELARHCKKDKDGKCKKGYEAILEYAEDDNNGYYIGRDDLYIDMTLNTFAGIGDVITAIRSLDVLKRLSIKKEEAPETYWRYTGPPAQRDFCRAMLRLADRGKIFTTDEVNKMASLNREFGPRGGSSYDKLAWKGGPNCVHYWTKLEVFKGDTGNKVIIASNRADNKREDRAMKSNNGLGKNPKPSPQGAVPNNAYLKKRNFSFNIDDEKRIVMGPVMIPNKMILRRDEDGNPFYIYFSKKTIRKMAEKFFRTNKHNNTDINHDENITNDNTLIESWISESIRHDKSYKYGFALPEGTWYVSYKINDDETWERIKQGELKGFSLAGGFIQKMKPVDPDKTLDEIKDILKKVKQ
jgi:hypothetical protein